MVEFELKSAGVVVPEVEFVPVVLVDGEDWEGTARIPGRATKPNPVMTPSITTNVSLVLSPSFNLRLAFFYSGLL